MTHTIISAIAIFTIIGTFLQWGLTHAYPHVIM